MTHIYNGKIFSFFQKHSNFFQNWFLRIKSNVYDCFCNKILIYTFKCWHCIVKLLEAWLIKYERSNLCEWYFLNGEL